MHDPRPVRLGQPLGHLGGERDQPLHGERPVGEQLAKRRPVDELHREIGDGVRLPDLVDRDDRRVVQGRRGARLPLEPAQPVRVGRQGRGQDFDRHVAAEARVMGPVHLAHAARPERRHELVGTEPGTGRQGHVGRDYRALVALPRLRRASPGYLCGKRANRTGSNRVSVYCCDRRFCTSSATSHRGPVLSPDFPPRLTPKRRMGDRGQILRFAQDDKGKALPRHIPPTDPKDHQDAAGARGGRSLPRAKGGASRQGASALRRIRRAIEAASGRVARQYPAGRRFLAKRGATCWLWGGGIEPPIPKNREVRKPRVSTAFSRSHQTSRTICVTEV